jgi:glycosyltransferase involved in cell wall biosynthesis
VTDTRPVILTLLGVFQPGFDATGPNQSLLRMVEALGDRFRFRVIARALADDVPGRWTTLHGVDRLPLARGRPMLRGLRDAINTTPHDLIVSNGLFDMELTVPALAMRRAGLIAGTPMMVAPRGEFSPGALAIKGGRKRAFLRVAGLTGLLGGVSVQATGTEERDHLRAALPRSGPILIGPNVRTLPALPARADGPADGPLKVAFLSRIDRKKNLDFALDALAAVASPVEFAIYGPVTDDAFWAECQAKIAAMPARHRVIVYGAIPQTDVPAALAASDLFFLPTLGENYGHSIVDALAVGTPVLISDRTPWTGLEAAGAGWDLALDNTAQFTRAIETVARSDYPARQVRRSAARAFIERALDPAQAASELEQCFRTAMSSVKRS